ncbi:FliH/SctL family protein [Microbacterium sp. GCS4]|uniref:FliH/SctL family protein n=1 Tax=Microbacterium sp. GCS4 TaxID=1692239 RepID=UPI000A522F8F|nr:FliH/SctL family protein [Microbacterium sp. GCS4]
MLDPVFTPLVVPRVGETPIDLRGETDRARTRGYAEGFAEGRRIALDRAQVEQTEQALRMQEMQAAFVERAQAALDAVRSARAALEQRVTDVAAVDADRIEHLAVELASAIVGAELSDPARSAAHALRRALDEMPVGRWTRVSFSTRDARTLRADNAAMVTIGEVELVASDAVDDGGSVVEIADGAVDARIEAAFARVRAALRGDDESGGDDEPGGDELRRDEQDGGSR